MSSDIDLILSAQLIIGKSETVTAAGVFGLQDDYRKILIGGAVAGLITEDFGAGPLASGAIATAGIHASRELNAQSQGLAVRMLVAVTEQNIYIFALTSFGRIPERELLCLNRATTRCTVTRFGASRHILLSDATQPGCEIGLTGTTAVFSHNACGDKSVISCLAA